MVGNLVENNFRIWDFVLSSEQMDFLVESDSKKESFSNLLENLRKEGYLAKMGESNGELTLSVQKAPESEESNIWINILLFIATIGTTFGVAGYWYLYDGNVLKRSFVLLCTSNYPGCA